MSILSKLCESASATVPFDQAKPIVNYEERRNISRSRDHQQFFEEQEREIERDILGPPMIEGLSTGKPKRRRQEEVVEPVVEVWHAALFCHSGVKGNVNVDCWFAVVPCG